MMMSAEGVERPYLSRVFCPNFTDRGGATSARSVPEERFNRFRGLNIGASNM